MFDTSYYLQENPDVAQSGINPLLHFAVRGAAEGRRPHPRYSPEEYLETAARRGRGEAPRGEAAPQGTAQRSPRRPRFTASLLRSDPAPANDGQRAPTAILVCHILPFPPRAGNEYRVHRLLRWLRSCGHEVHLVISPLPGEAFDPEHVRRASLEYPNLVICERDGTVRYQSRRSEARAALAALDGVRARTFPRMASRQRIAGIERTFCPDLLLDVLVRLGEAIRPDAVIASYVFMSRALRLFPRGVLKIIDTHDVFSTKGRKVVQFGITDDLAMSAVEEAAMLRRADLIVAIQPEEERELREIVPDRRVVTAGVDFDLAPNTAAVAERVVLCVASANALNVRGVRDFLSLAWPLVRRELPDARVQVAGPVCAALDATEGVELLGPVDHLASVYSRARVVVNPTVAGTGLKIKTLEALSHLRPLVSWPSGVDGLSPAVKRLCCVATDWYEFSRHIVRLLSDDAALDLATHREVIRQQLSADAVYAEILGAMEAARGASGDRSARNA